jgi:glycosyltransferase involved in cell wall biosynthesis
MKVFVISHSSVVEGFRRKWAELARRPGISLTLLVPSCWPEGGQWVRYVPGAASAPYRVISARALLAGIHALHCYPLLPWYLVRHRPHVLHIEEEPWNAVTVLAALVGKLLGAKVCFFTWENVRRTYPFPLSLFLRVVLRLSDRAVAGSETARALLRERGFRKPVDVLAQHGVDVLPLAPRGTPASGTFTIGFAGRLVPEKGLTSLIDAVARLSPAARLLVVGDGPYRPQIEEHVRRAGLEGRVEMAGAVRHLDMSRYLRRMDLLVLPSLTTARWKEQFGRVLVEAMVLGVPVVGSDSGEIPSVIGDAGLVFPEGDSEQLARRIEALVDDPGLRHDMVERGRTRVRSRFTNDVLAERLRAIYDDLVLTAGVAAGHAPGMTSRSSIGGDGGHRDST